MRRLKPKILVPIVAFCILCISLVVLYSYRDYKKHLISHGLERARQLSQTLGACSQIVHYPYELQRLVYALGSQIHVQIIAIVYQDPLTILASNRNTLIGQKWITYPLPYGIRLPNFPLEQEAYDFIPQRHTFNYALGFYYVKYHGETLYSPAYIVIQIDTECWQKEFLKQSINMIALASSILIVFVIIFIVLINHWVLSPLTAIKRQMNKRRLGNPYAMAPIFSNDEIGDLSKVINEMIYAREKTESLYQKLVDIAPILLWTTNRDNSYFYFNKRWCEFVGQSSLIYKDWSWLQHIDRQARQHYQQQFLRAQKKRESVVFECKMKDAIGKEHWMLCQYVPQILPDGSFEGYISSLVDVTEHKENEKRLAMYAQELAKARDIALKSAQAKSAFLATMSHEIRTPINGILGFTYLLQGTPLSTEQQDYVYTIASSTQILLDLINQILDLSKIEASKMQLEPLNFCLPRCIRDICTLFRPMLNKKQLKLSVWLHPQLPSWLYGDSKRLRQILMNLLSNAIKFTPSGTISIRVTGRPLNDNRYQVFISVQDQGIGIPQQDIQRIFQAFEQVSYQNQGGTGLGLAISKSLVKLMGGQLKVHSQVNKGTIFFFSVYMQPGLEEIVDEAPAELSSPKIEAPSPSPHADHTILLVDDNAENQRLAQKILEKQGYAVEVVGNGVQCLEWLQHNQVDLIIMDVNMPEMDGCETTQRIRSGECGLEKAAIPILGLTAQAFQETYDLAISIGMNAVLSKPFQPKHLLHTVASWIHDSEKFPLEA